MFHKKAVFEKFCSIHTCVGLLLNNVASQRPVTLSKKKLQHRCFLFFYTYFKEHLRKDACAGVLLEFCNDRDIYEKKNCVFLNVKERSFVTLEIQVLY